MYLINIENVNIFSNLFKKSRYKFKKQSWVEMFSDI
jgi:hypothetical protein